MITIAEIQEAVKGNPALVEEIANGFETDIVKVFSEKKGLVIRSKTDEESYLGNYLKQKKDEIVAPVVKEIHDKYDADLNDLFGEKKGPHEKTYDFMKRKIAEVNEKASKTTDPVLKEKYQALETQMKTMKDDYEKKLSDKDSEFFNKEIDSLLGITLEKGSIAIPSHIIKEEDKQAFVAKQRGMLKSDFLNTFTAKRDEKGNVVFYKDDKILTSTKDGKPLTAEDLINENYSHYFVKSSKSQGGAGTGGKKNSEGKVVYATKEEAYEAVKSLGIKERTNEFTQKYTEYCTHSGLL